MHYTFDAFRICSIRCWGKERMQHFMNAVIMHQNGGYNNAGAFRRSCIIIHFVELHLLHTAFTKIWCAFSYVLHSAALRCSSRFTLDALRTLPISGSTADLPLPFSGPSSSLILAGTVLTLICSPLQKTPLALRRCLLNATTTHSVVVLCASTDDVMIPDPKLTAISPFTHENYDIMTEGLLTLLFCPSSSRHRVDQMQPNIMQQNV